MSWMSCSWLTFVSNSKMPLLKGQAHYPVLVKRQSTKTTTTEKTAVQHKRSFYFSVYVCFPFSSTMSQIYLHVVIHWLEKGFLSADHCCRYSQSWFECICYNTYSYRSNFLCYNYGCINWTFVRTIPAIIKQYICGKKTSHTDGFLFHREL